MPRCLVPLVVLLASVSAFATASAASAAPAGGTATQPAGTSVVQLSKQVATLTRRNARLKGQVANLKGQITLQLRQNDLLSTTNKTLTTNNAALTTEISSAEQTIGGTGNLPTRLAALQALVGVQAVPASAVLFSPLFQQSNASLGSDVTSQLTVFLQEFNATNLVTPSQNHLTFTLGPVAPASLSALFPPAAPGDPTTS
jgi:TolA-binding protein